MNYYHDRGLTLDDFTHDYHHLPWKLTICEVSFVCLVNLYGFDPMGFITIKPPKLGDFLFICSNHLKP